MYTYTFMCDNITHIHSFELVLTQLNSAGIWVSHVTCLSGFVEWCCVYMLFHVHTYYMQL